MGEPLWGATVARVLARIASADRYSDLIVPTLADLQYEAARAESGFSRCYTVARAYLALVRVLVVPYPARRSKMERLIKIAAVGVVSSVALVLLESRMMRALVEEWIGRQPGNFAITALVAVMVPSGLAVRGLRLAPTFRAAFLAAFMIGVMTLSSLMFWIMFVDSPTTLRLDNVLGALAMITGFSALGGLFAAAVIWTPSEDSAHGTAAWLRQCCVALGIAAIALALTAVVAVLVSQPLSLRVIADSIHWSTFRGLWFLLIGLVIYVPLLTVIRRAVRRSVPLAVIGALLFPIPLWTMSLASGHPQLQYDLWFRSPGRAFLFSVLPHLVAGAVLGWRLATDARTRQNAVEA
jgi:hypothetical protein